MTETPRAHDRKPDSDEPWRYVCPECGAQVQGHHTHRLYRCRCCSKSYRQPQLRDLVHTR